MEPRNGNSSKVRVFARVHRNNTEQQVQGAQRLVHVRDNRTVSVLLQRHAASPEHSGSNGNRPRREEDGATYETFKFCQVLGHGATQEEVYDTIGADLVTSFCGENNQQSCSVFAYGQTGSGKTFSMTGGETYAKRGLIPRALASILEHCKRNGRGRPTLYLSYCEIYEEKLRDLLYASKTRINRKAGRRREPKPVESCRERQVHSEETALEVFFKGNANRVTSGTVGNSFSSRSHCIFSIRLEGSSARLNFVDLAGSERWTMEKDRETRSINLSLHYLEQVVLQMTEQSPRHINFRNSTMTRLLKDSFCRKSKTVFLMTLQESNRSSRESLSTCRFAVRCQKLNVRRHQDYLGMGRSTRGRSGNPKEIERLTVENERLEQELSMVKETFKKKEEEIMHLLDLIDPIEDMLTHGQYFANVRFKGSTMPKLHLWVSPCFSALHIGSPRRMLDLGTLQKIVCAPIGEHYNEQGASMIEDESESESDNNHYMMNGSNHTHLGGHVKENLWEVLFISRNVVILQFEAAQPWVPCFESLLAKYKSYNGVGSYTGNKSARPHYTEHGHGPTTWSFGHMREKLQTHLSRVKSRASSS